MSRRLRALLITAALIVGTWLAVPADAQGRFWVLVNGAMRYNGPVLVGNGSAAAPSQSFASEPSLGWYRAGAGTLTAGVGGTAVASVVSTGIQLNQSGSSLMFGSTKLFIATAPTISSGFGTSPSIVSSNGTATFRVNVGTGGVATSGVVGLPTASTGWNCLTTDITNSTVTRQTADSTTTATVTAAAAWAASDILLFQCVAF